MLNLDFYRDNIYNTQLVNEAKRHAKNAHLRSILLSIDKSKKTARGVIDNAYEYDQYEEKKAMNIV